MAARFWTGTTNAMAAIVLWTFAVVIQEFLLTWFAILDLLGKHAVKELLGERNFWGKRDPRHVKKSPA